MLGQYVLQAPVVQKVDFAIPRINHYPVNSAVGFPNIYVVVNFLSQVIFVFILFLGMIMYANEVETKEK